MFPAQEGSLFFAPMEGITDPEYRINLHNCFPEWDYYATDFLRVPAAGMYPDSHILKHYGKEIYNNDQIKNKTIYQILTSEKAFTKEIVQKVYQLNFSWLDLNLGCPSKTVCKNKGGSFLLSDLKVLRPIIKTIRENFPLTFTAKIRVGYKDDSNFINILKMLEDEGVDAITIHARTRDELYKGVAKWDYVKQAVKAVNIPIVGNGDIWTVKDIHDYFDFTECHSVMIARGAMKTPWLAKNYHQGIIDESAQSRIENIKFYYANYMSILDAGDKEEAVKVKRLKAVSRYLFDDLPNGAKIKRSFLLSKSRQEAFDVLERLPLLIKEEAL